MRMSTSAWWLVSVFISILMSLIADGFAVAPVIQGLISGELQNTSTVWDFSHAAWLYVLTVIGLTTAILATVTAVRLVRRNLLRRVRGYIMIFVGLFTVFIAVGSTVLVTVFGTVRQ